MSAEKNIQNIEAQKQVEGKDSNSNVKTPLVDALRFYFWNVSEAIEGQPATHR